MGDFPSTALGSRSLRLSLLLVRTERFSSPAPACLCWGGLALRLAPPGPAPTPRKAGGPRKACPGCALLPSRPWACPSVSNDRAQVTHDCNLWEGREERGREHSPALRPSRLRRECVPVMGSLQGASRLPSPDLCQPQPAPRGGNAPSWPPATTWPARRPSGDHLPGSLPLRAPPAFLHLASEVEI